MKEFIRENPGLISKILEVQTFNKEDLVLMKKLIDSNQFKIYLSNSCPNGVSLNAGLEEGIENLGQFKAYLKEKELFEDYTVTKCASSGYRVRLNTGKDSVLEMLFNCKD